MNHTEVLLIGASVRAAAQSARRAGLEPWGADLFGDRDLRALGDFRRIGNYPHSFRQVSDKGPPGPWMYTGALENHPALVDQMARVRPLWGNDGHVLRRVRSPFLVHEVFSKAGIPCPAVRDSVPVDGRWLMKPRNGAAGRGIAFWNGQTLDERHFLQQFVEGESWSAIYIGEQGRATLLGVTHQMVGEDWLHVGTFQYCGSVGPIDLQSAQRRHLERLGDTLAAAFELRGIFGVDCVLCDGVPLPVEVNPRYTASVEVLELATGVSALAWHRRAFEEGTSVPARTAVPGGILGKAVLFAPSRLTFLATPEWAQVGASSGDLWVLPSFADIPHAGQIIESHKPILTFFARAQTPAACLERLRQIAADLDRRLYAS